jgi:hypothetical protein
MSVASATAALSPAARALGLLGAAWGVVGISVLLLGGVFSMGPYALQLSWAELSGLERFALLAYLAFMIGGKGYMGFHRGFSPRAAARAAEIARDPRPLRVLLAPLYGMSLIQASMSRLVRSWGLMLAIASIVPLVKVLPQPWRGIVDAGVVAGLSVGLLSFWWFALLRPLVGERDKVASG